MARKISIKNLEVLLTTLKSFPLGATLDDILQTLPEPLPKRSIQRYLAILVNEGRLNLSGSSRSRRYYLPSMEKQPETPPSQGNKQTTHQILLSKEALSIEALVKQPIQKRQPVGYNRNFLNNYHPNKTYYLSEDIRKHLFEIGKSPNGSRPAGTYARQIFNRLLIDLSWNSSRLEGNTYSLLETQRLLELGEIIEGKDNKETQMILNHKAAIEFMVESSEYIQYNQFTIFNLHALLSDNLLDDPQACGNLRSIPVGIGKSVYLPLAIPQLISEYFKQILDAANSITDPFEQAFFIMVQLPYLQPFLVVNKRVSRLAANISLIQKNLCPLSFVDVSEELYISGLLGIYELNRIELLRDVFVWAYERSSSLYSEARQQLGEPDLFRLQHRNLIISTIGEIIRRCMNKQLAVAFIKQTASENLSKNDHAKFIQVIETQLMGLHKGNIARFKLKPSEYDTWITIWR